MAPGDRGPARVEILGTAVDRVDFREALDRIRGLVESGEGGLVVTANPEMVMTARRDAKLREALGRARLVVADGVGLVWAARRLGTPLAGRVTGIELMDELLGEAAGRGWGVYVLGARPEVLERAVAAMRERHPGLRVAGSRDGFFPLESADEVARDVERSGARLLLMGMGVPREQHFWLAAEDAGLLAPVVALGVGGSLDVWGGAARRAPAWMRRLGLEWLYRLVREPWRWRRQLALPAFAWRVLRGG